MKTFSFYRRSAAGLIVCGALSVGADAAESVRLTMDPNGVAPLAGRVDITSDVPTRVTLIVMEEAGTRYIDFPDFQTTHSLALLGLRPDREHSLQVRFTAEDSMTRYSRPIRFTTPPLPADFPVIDVLVSEPEHMEPGFTLLDLYNGSRQSSIQGRAMILDSAGDVVWLSTLGTHPGNVRNAIEQLPNGNIRALASRNEQAFLFDTIVEQDMLGNVVNMIELFDPGAALHHDLIETVDGTFISLSQTPATVYGFPTSDSDPNAPTQTANVRDEGPIEFNPDGSVRAIWPLVTLIDPVRIGYNSLQPSSNGFDAFHTNAVLHVPSDDSIIVSARHQDAVFKFSRETGQLIWILGNHHNWSPAFVPFLLEPIGQPFEWQYHQHAMMPTPQGTLLLYDNGNHRASPFDGTVPLADNETYSRAVEYEIDEAAMTVRQVREIVIGGDNPIFSATRGDADWLPETGNILTTSSDVRFEGGVASADLGYGVAHTRIIEYATDPVIPVFDVRVRASSPTGRIHVYRSDRIASLYPESIETRGPLGPIEVRTGWAASDVCFEIDNDGDWRVAEDGGIAGSDDDTDGGVDEDPAECPNGTSAGTSLARPDGDGYLVRSNGGVYEPDVFYAVTSLSVHWNAAAIGMGAFYDTCDALLDLDENGAGAARIVLERPDGTLEAVYDFRSQHPGISGQVGDLSTSFSWTRTFMPGETIHLYVRMRQGAQSPTSGGCYMYGGGATVTGKGLLQESDVAVLSIEQ